MHKDTQYFEALLKRLLDEHMEKRRALEESRQNLTLKEVEFEEMAAKQQMAIGLEQLDDQEKERIAAIEHALYRLRSGLYDTCESCGHTISSERLEAIPWATQCIDCAERAEGGVARRMNLEEEYEEEPSPLAAEKTHLSEELQGLSDEQLVAAVIDAIRRDGNVLMEELTVTCRNRQLRIEGLLPDKRQHSHLQQIVYDILGFEDVEEQIKIDRTAWERTDRTSGIDLDKTKEDSEDSDSIEGSDTEIIEAVKEGKSITPADEIIPEKER